MTITTASPTSAASTSVQRGGSERGKRAFWFDPRFAIGIVLVLASVLGVAALVTSADSSIDVLAARQTLVPGQRVSASDLVPTSIRADHAAVLYLRSRDIPASGVVVTRAVDVGELVPTSAVGSTAGLDLTSVVVPLDTPLSQSVAASSRVDVWSAKQVTNGVFAAPTVLVSSAIVVRLVEDKGIVVDSTDASVELLVPRDATASVLEAVANGAALSVVPVDLPVDR
jgi:hypothetical protein